MTHLPNAHQNMPKQSQTREKECGWWWGEPDRHSTSAGSVESRIEPTGIYSPNLATETNQQKFFNVTLRDSLDMNIKITWDHWFDGQPYIMLRSHLSEVPSIVPLDHRYRGGGGGITCPRINGCIPRSLRDLSFIHDTRQNLGCSAPDKNKPYTTGFAISRSWMTSVIQQVLLQTDPWLKLIMNSSFSSVK